MSGTEKETGQELKVTAADATTITHTSGFYPPLRLARAYVPPQRYGRTYSPAEALEKGTLFPELYSPYPY
ncbi:spore coat associated protein CotJA [Desulfofundulus thermocisternus]|uniref:spore coat associated protein CotJA n=1 Tax=Desulfofundulus thermocisternus TaxID=42471 RepID=UPI00055053DA|nr:spore coat associated protein CotJA [Desulfofundulus thermocisternus]